MKKQMSMTQLAATWWGEMMIPNPNRRTEFCRQLETSLREKEKTASDHEAVFVLGVGHRLHPLLALAIENAGLTAKDLNQMDAEDPIYMNMDFRERRLDVQTGYRAPLRTLYPQ